MVESVSESIDAAFAAFEQAAAGEQAGSDEHPAATPQDHQPAAETEPTGDGIRDALEAGWAQLETGARDPEALDEVFAPLTGRMAEQKLTRATVVKEALAPRRAGPPQPGRRLRRPRGAPARQRRRSRSGPTPASDRAGTRPRAARRRCRAGNQPRL